MAHRLHSGDARRYVRMAQLAGVALGVSAAALWALDVPGLVYREPARPQLPEQAAASQSTTQEVRFDRDRYVDMADRLNLGVKRAPPPVKTEPPATAQKEPEPPPVTGPIVYYIGCIYEGSRMLAVLSVDGRQRIVPEGRLIGDARLVSIAENQIELQESGGRRTIQRAERTSSAVSWLRSMPSNTAVAANIPGQNAGRRGAQNNLNVRGTGAFSPEMEQRFRDRGIDPQQAQRWREAVRQREAQSASGQVPVAATLSAEGVLMDADVQGIGTITIPRQDAEDGIWTETYIQENEDEVKERLKQLEERGQQVGEDGEIRP